MSLIEILKDKGGNYAVEVGDEFSGDIGIYAAAWALSEVLKKSGLGGGIVWRGQLPPAVDVFPLSQPSGQYIPLVIGAGTIEVHGFVFDWRFSPAELFMSDADSDQLILAAVFVSLYAGTEGFSAEGINTDILLWFKSVLERGFEHYKWVDLIYILSSPKTLNIWGEIMAEARFLPDGRVVGVWSGDDTIPMSEWKRLASLLSRAGELGEVYVREGDVWRVYSSDGTVRTEEKLPW